MTPNESGRGCRGASPPPPRRRCPSAAAPPAARRPSGRVSRSTSCCRSSEPRPPIPVPITQPTRVRVVGELVGPSRPASSASSAAATASWVKRSWRRASLRDRKSAGSKSSQRRDAVVDPALAGGPALDEGLAPTPSGVTAPTPVMTTRRVIAALRATTRSITSPTVLTSLTESPSSSTPNSSSTIWASSTRSSESTSRSSKVASRVISPSAPISSRPSKITFSTASVVTCGWHLVLLSRCRLTLFVVPLQALRPPSTVSDRAGHVAGLVGGEEAHAGGDLLRGPGAAGRDPSARPLLRSPR